MTTEIRITTASQNIKITGINDEGAWHRAVMIARELYRLGKWDGIEEITIHNPYTAHNKIAFDWYPPLTEGEDYEFLSRPQPEPETVADSPAAQEVEFKMSDTLEAALTTLQELGIALKAGRFMSMETGQDGEMVVCSVCLMTAAAIQIAGLPGFVQMYIWGDSAISDIVPGHWTGMETPMPLINGTSLFFYVMSEFDSGVPAEKIISRLRGMGF